jgi:hypothetical protein
LTNTEKGTEAGELVMRTQNNPEIRSKKIFPSPNHIEILKMCHQSCNIPANSLWDFLRKAEGRCIPCESIHFQTALTFRCLPSAPFMVYSSAWREPIQSPAHEAKILMEIWGAVGGPSGYRPGITSRSSLIRNTNEIKLRHCKQYAVVNQIYLFDENCTLGWRVMNPTERIFPTWKYFAWPTPMMKFSWS